MPDPQEMWQQLQSVQFQLDEAVAKEEFKVAAQLKDHKKSLISQLPPVDQYLYHQLQLVQTGTLEQRQAAVRALGETGTMACADVLAACLHRPQLMHQAHEALMNIFLRHRQPRVNELMQAGMALMGYNGNYLNALEVFDQVIAEDPEFAEGHNKKATCLYLLGEYQQSVEVCKVVLKLNPYHWAAASGMGLCLQAVKQYEEAIHAFERAKSIHPGMACWVDSSIEKLRDKIAQMEKKASPE